MRRLLSWFVFCGVTAVVPARLAGVNADPDDVSALSAGVADWLDEGVSTADFGTGNPVFDAEWVFGTWMMAAMGFGQSALVDDDPVHEERLVAAIDRLLTAEARAFDQMKWGSDPLDDLASDRGRIAWLGYLGLALGMERLVVENAPHAALHDRVVAAIEARFRSRRGLVETYPGEWYPVDNAAAIGALGLHTRATGRPHPDYSDRLRRAIDPDTGLLIQFTDSAGRARSPGRGSGTFLAAYFLSFGDPALSRELYEAGRTELYGELAGFGAMREFPSGEVAGGDIDSGPIVGGFGVSATGFAMGAAGAHGDRATRQRLWATAAMFGAPGERDGRTHFATGGPIGDAILFAMLTAQVPE